MDFERFKEITSNRVDPRWDLESIRELYDICGGSRILTDEEVLRVGAAYRLGITKGYCSGLTIARGIVQASV